ncbi:MAG: Hsp70 family protein, partial [SAR324 cluster bacterium]|nr:Hsp70 family protein [SAR324 cluster bacterium]
FVIDKNVKFQDIIGYLIAHLKVQAENQLEGSIDSVVMGRPVHFNDHDSAKDHEAEELLKTIAQNQGFKNVEFQFEPIAAALAYEQKSVTKETLALVADIGGGTSDFSVIKLGSNNFDRKQDILANAGIHIGGTDFDRKISVKEVMPFFGANSEIKDMSGKSLKVPKAFFSDMATWHRINSLYCDEVKESIAGYIKNAPNSASLGRFQTLIEYEFGHLLNTRIEQQKQILSSKTQSVLDLGFIEKGLTLPLLQEKSNEAILEEITKLSNITNEILMQAGVAASDIDVIFFTGGSTKIPILREYIFNNIPKAEVVEGDAFGSVGYGLAVDAEKRFR